MLLLLSLTAALASDNCSLWEHANGYTGADCTMANDYDYNQVVTTAAAGDLGLRWVPECMDGGSSCAAEQRVRCIDGTRPAYHVELTGSRDWVVYFQGGGSCSRKTEYDPVSGTYTVLNTAWEECEDRYLTEPKEMGTTAIRTAIDGSGVLSGAPANPFAGANKVKIHKCSYDRMAGVATRDDVVDGAGVDAVLYFHGRRIAKAVLADLALNMGPDSLAEHDRVLFAGNSGGAGGLIFTADKYTSWIHGDLGLPTVETRLLLDARMRPSVENNAAFDAGHPGATLYSYIANGTSEVSAVESFDYNALTYRQTGSGNGPVRSEYETWYGASSAAARDDSCALAHGSDPWRCYDEGHVLANHIETPVFASHSLADGNHAKNMVPFALHGATYGQVLWNELCSDQDLALGRTPGTCFRAYGDRAYEQAGQIYAAHPEMGLWTLNDTQHGQAYNDERWGNTGKGLCNASGVKTTLGEAVWQWFNASSGVWLDETQPGWVSTWNNPVACP